MNNQPLVSILVPCYNHSKYLEKTIESVVTQTYKNIELLIIDDGSSDNSAEILEILSKKFDFYFEKQQNMGLPETLNKLIYLSKGKYVTSIASDDILVLDKIEKQVDFMEKNPSVGACFGNMLMINESGEILPWYYQRFIKFKSYVFGDVIRNNAISIYSPTNMFRKTVLDQVGCFDKNYPLEDLFIILKITYNNFKIVVLPDLFTYYRVHNTNITKQYKFIFREKLKVLKMYRLEPGYKIGVFKTIFIYYIYLFLSLIPKKLNPFK